MSKNLKSSGASNGVTEEQLLDYFFVGLQGGLKKQIRPHNLRDLVTTMEVACDVEEPGVIPGTNGGTKRKSGQTWGRYQGSSGTIARTETYKGNQDGLRATSGGNVSKKEGTTSTLSSNVGSNAGGEMGNQG